MLNRFFSLGLSCLLLVVLAACGGGGGSSSTPTPEPTPPPANGALSGVAAAGAPIIGTVYVKDADGVVRTALIEANGHYTVDVSGMKAPFKLRASGHVGPLDVDLYSAALLEDVNNTINITPFTDLIIANIAGQVAANYFASADTSSLTAAELTQETARVRDLLASVLAAAGVETSIDLLRASFNADSTGLDRVMDIIKVAVDPATGAVEIRNVLDNSSLTYNVATPEATSGAINPPSATTLSDFDQIVNGTKAFFNLFLAGVPTEEQIRALGYFDEVNFKQGGLDFSQQYTENWMNPYMANLRLQGFRFVALTADTAVLELSLELAGETVGVEAWRFTKTSGFWKCLGNQRIAELYIDAHASVAYGDGWGPMYNSGVTIGVTGNDPNLAYAIVTGPGLPTEGVRLYRWDACDNLSTSPNDGECTDSFGMDDSTITLAFSGLNANIPYSFKLYDASDSELANYTEPLLKSPLTRVAIQPYLPTLTSPATVSDLQALISSIPQDGTQVSKTISWTIPQGLITGEVSVHLAGANGNTGNYDVELPASNSVPLMLQSPGATLGAPSAITWAQVGVHAYAGGREFDMWINTTMPIQ